MNDEEGSIWDEEVKQPQGGFPVDDEYGVEQGCQNSCDCVYCYYVNQFVQDERHNWKDWKGKKGTIDLIIEHTPVLSGSLIGLILDKNDKRIAAFTFTDDGMLSPIKYGSDIELEASAKIINSGSLNEITGELSLNCNLDKFDLVLDYEYNIG